MFAAYRPALGNGGRTVDVEAEPVKEDKPVEDEEISANVRRKFAQYRPEQPAAQPPIVRKEGDENSAVYWNQFASGDGQRLVESTTAVYTVKTIVSESVGPRYSQSVAFREESVSVADVLAAIEKLSGPAGWRLVQKKAGFVASP